VKNYGSLASILLAAINQKNAAIAAANEQTRNAQRELADAQKREKDSKEAADASVAKFQADLQAERDANAQDRSQFAAKLGEAQTTLDEQSKKAQAVLAAASATNQELTATSKRQETTITRLNEDLRKVVKGLQGLAEQPDGRIVQVNQKQGLVWLDVGRAEGLLRQTTFRVYDQDTSNISAATPKGSIEVVGFVGDRQAEARITEDSPRNPILPGDIIQSPAWSPGQQLHFALALKMDINGDGVDDFDLVRSIIQLSGGVIDAELRADGTRTGSLSATTRYFIHGELPDETSDARLLPANAAMDREREAFGIEKIEVKKFLAMMGWKPDSRTVVLSGSRGTDFRQRAPGKAPAAGAAPAAATGGAAPAETTAPPAAAPADPFATPAADPFATP
jgi:hypothetical protein